MLSQYIRVFTRVNTDPLIDVSMENQDGEGISPSGKTLYIAQNYPFANLFFLMSAFNTVDDIKPTISYWDGVEWRNMVDILDFGKGLKKSAMIQYSLDNQYSWNRIARTDSDTSYAPDELQGLNINDCYWLKISFTPDLHADTKIKRICYAFCTTAHINGIELEGPKFYKTIGTAQGDQTKSDWINEIITASEHFVNDLKAMNFIKHQGQIIRFDEFYLACAYRTLAHIYTNLGKAYVENKQDALAEYSRCLSSRSLTVDENKDGVIEECELNETQTRAYR